LINRIKVRGKIGSYGRSIGGIAATHLCRKFPNLISVFIGDRTMGNFEKIVKQKFQTNRFVLMYYRLWGNYIEVDNAQGVINAKKCYKILAFDDQDDVFDTFSSLHHSIAEKTSKNNYNTV
jgi:hypothetical protein